MSAALWLFGLIGTGAPGLVQGGGTDYAGVGGGVLAGLINLGLLWFVLFGGELWAKWCCGGCTAVGVLILVLTLFAGQRILQLVQAVATADDPRFASLSIGMLGAVIIGRILWDGWLVTILWRDIHRIR